MIKSTAKVKKKTISTSAMCTTLLMSCASMFMNSSAETADVQWATAVFPSGATFGLEIAADRQSQTRGYMFREHIGDREGMLFLFDEEGHHPIWMKNCRVSLDIIWLDARFRVIDIARDRPPCPETGECPSVFPMRAARYVLEVAGGVTTAEKLEPGDQLNVISRPSPRPSPRPSL